MIDHPELRRVLVIANDLVFRAKLEAIVRSAGADVLRDDASDARPALAVVELGRAGSEDRIRDLAARGVPVLAFGAHVQPESLRAARALGARAVPNSEVERTLRALLSG
ncbi:MAG: DNA-binding response regulator [Gemmatimonadales bacterium]